MGLVMATYHVTFFYRLLDKGWTETYYRQAPNGKSACDFSGDGIEFDPWLYWRPQAVKLQAVRAQKVDGLRSVYLRPLTATVGKSKGTPTPTPQMGVTYCSIQGGSQRRLDLRGLPDDFVKRSKSGRELIPSQFYDAVNGIGQAFTEFSLLGKRMVKTDQAGAYRIAPDPTNSQCTLVYCDDSFMVQPSQFVYFNGPPNVIGLSMRRPYLVYSYEPGVISIVRTWPEGLADQTFVGKVRTLEYEYAQLEDPRLFNYSTYKTSSAYRPASWEPWGNRATDFHPCGRVVDYLRTGYRAKMRLYRDSPDVLTPVRWYFPDQVKLPDVGGALIDSPPVFAVPYEHPFASGNWWRSQGYPGPLGEVRSTTWERGQPREVLSAWGLAGTRDQWENGLTSTPVNLPFNRATNKPCSCGPGVLAVSGGAAVGGRAEINIPTVADCTEWPAVAASWRFSMEGVSSGWCPNCADLNTTHVLTHSFGCEWFGTPLTICPDGGLFRLYYDGSGQMLLEFISQLGPQLRTTWALASADFDPLGENTLSLVQDEGDCDNWPATVTVHPLSGA